ncbi:hypothetical protein ACS0TY_022337 [Phlomoides rotata]
MIIHILNKRCCNKRKRGVRYSMIDCMSGEAVNMGRLIGGCNVLTILAHHKKNRVVKFNHQRSGQMISHYMHVVLLAVLKMHIVLFVRSCPGCLGGIDGTYINVHVSEEDKERYRMRKGTISTNMLVACDRNCMFTYILLGWEGSASDDRV